QQKWMVALRRVIMKPNQRLDSAVGKFYGDLCRAVVRKILRPETIQLKRALESIFAAGDDFTRTMPGDGHKRNIRPCWQIVRIAFRRPAINPIVDQTDLFLCKRLVIPKVSKTLYRTPRGHFLLKHILLDRIRPGTG